MSTLLRLAILLAALAAFGALVGCGRSVKGPRFWWDDQKRERLPDDYQLPPAPAKRPPTPLPHDIPEPLKDEHDKKMEKRQPKQRAEEPLAKEEDKAKASPAPDDAGASAVPEGEK